MERLTATQNIRDLAERYTSSAQNALGADERAYWSRLADTWMALAAASETPDARPEGALRPAG
jgi:hypothetical protein